ASRTGRSVDRFRPICDWRASPAESILMKISLEFQPAERVDAEALIVPVFEGRPETRFGAPGLAGEVTGKALEFTLLHHVPGVSATRVLLAGAGKPEKFTAAEQRNLAGAAVRCLKLK